MNTKSTVIALLLILLGLVPSAAEPFRNRDVNPTSPWAAHLDFTRLGDLPLERFLQQVAGFDRIMELKTVLKENLDLDWRSISGVTLFGAGDKSGATAIVLRGDFAAADFSNLPPGENLPIYDGIQLKQGPKWQRNSLILAARSDKEWVAGTSVKSVKEALDILAGRKVSGMAPALTPQAESELRSSAAMFSLDMKKLNGEIAFEADFTRAVQRAWFLIGPRDNLVEATLMIESTDAEGLIFLRQQLQVLTSVLASRTDLPSVWLELAGAIKVETKGNWMTVKVAASPKQSVTFLKSLEQFFVGNPDSSGPGQ